MEELGTPTLVLLAIQTVVLPWSVWVTLQVFELKKELALNDQRDADISKLITEVNRTLARVDKHLQSIMIALARKGIEVETPK